MIPCLAAGVRRASLALREHKVGRGGACRGDPVVQGPGQEGQQEAALLPTSALLSAGLSLRAESVGPYLPLDVTAIATRCGCILPAWGVVVPVGTSLSTLHRHLSPSPRPLFVPGSCFCPCQQEDSC